jgi:hypothetical protein
MRQIKEIQISKIDSDNNKIYLQDGQEFEYILKEIAVQRTNHDNLPIDLCDRYVLKPIFQDGVMLSGCDVIFIYHNKWSFFAPLELENFEEKVIKIIEKRKQMERIGNKYKYIQFSDKYTLKQIFPIYQDITCACDQAIDGFYEVLKKLKLNPKKSLTLRVWIDGSKHSDYKYNYLFTEYFEEEAN